MRRSILAIPVAAIVAAGVYGLFGYLRPDSKPIKPGDSVDFGSTVSGDDSLQNPIPYTYEPLAEDLFVPWSIVFTSENRILVTERNGQIRQIQNGALDGRPLITFDQISASDEEGLMGMALDPGYTENAYIYVCLAYPKNGGLADRVVRLRDGGDELTEDRVILDDIPAARFHAGCRLGFGPDGKLYITTGDATRKELAQDLSSLAGKILRIHPDGTIPSDNPFPDSPVYSYGHRNPQGIDWHPSGSIFSMEHGPSGFDGPGGGDEVNIIRPGGNYGWPVVSHEESQEGMEDPLLVFTPAEAPASALIYTGDIFPQFRGHLFFGALRGEGIMHIILDRNDPSKVLGYEKLDVNVGRVREVRQGPDGYIYFTTSNRDGRGEVRAGDDRLYRIVPSGD